MPKNFASQKKKFFEKLVQSKTIYRGSAVGFLVDNVRLPSGRAAVREYLDHPGAVGVVAFVEENRVLMVRQYRYAVRRVTLELPAGKLDSGESPIQCVKRELKEETGYTARRFVPLLRYWPTPAFANEELHLFAAAGLTPGRSKPDEDECIEVEKIPFKKALQMVRSGRIKDSKTVVGLLAAAVWKPHSLY